MLGTSAFSARTEFSVTTGSGKSFFMRLLYDRVEQIAGAGSASFCSRIAQIKFNAWHYTDQNLWASLVSEIFDGLFSWIAPQSPQADEIKLQLEQQEGLYKEAKLRLEAAVKASDTAANKLSDLVEKRKQREQGLGGFLDDFRALVREDPALKNAVTDVSKAAGLQEPIQSYEALENEVTNLRSLAGRINALRRTTRPTILLAALLTPIILPVLVARTLFWLYNAGTLKDLHWISGVVVTFIGSVLVWLVPLTDRASKVVASAEQGLNRVRRARQDWILSHAAKQQSELAALRAKEEAARAELTAIQARVEQLQQERDDLQPGRQMLKFIRERSGSGDYRQYMGLISLIRKDFQTLSDLLISQGNDAPVQRIVLYVDDLDRCPPDRVVEVLEAIHLLLAFSLFVVVVGVDSRWIAHSLSVKYPGLLRADVHDADAAASPNDYLEKIFQIPFWMRPISEEGSKKLISGLIPLSSQTPSETSVEKERPETGAHADVKTAELQVPSPPDQHRKPSSQARDAGPHKKESLPRREKSAPPEAERLRIEAVELNYMNRLAGFLGDSPRRIKRFLNTYRLIKASLPAGEAVTFVGSSSEPGEFRAAQIVLALHTAAPDSAVEVSRQLHRPMPSESVTDLLKHIDGFAKPDLLVATGLLQKYRETWGEDLHTLRRWNDVMTRYSFQSQ
jgi:KAP-like P-loop domain-containing protein